MVALLVLDRASHVNIDRIIIRIIRIIRMIIITTMIIIIIRIIIIIIIIIIVLININININWYELIFARLVRHVVDRVAGCPPCSGSCLSRSILII